MQKRQFTAEFKAKIVLEILREEHTVSEIAAREQISAKQLHNWKKEFLDNAERVFAQSKLERDYRHQLDEAAVREAATMAKVGQLTLEVDLLKKKYKQIHGRDWDGGFRG
jgi:Transposase and inactivated derivatives